MTYNSDGVYTNVVGASSAAAGQIVQSAVWNAINEGYGEALTQAMTQLLGVIPFRNALYMNGGFEIWQRGAGSAASIAVAQSTTTYTSDRWYITTNANQASTVSAQTGLVAASQLCGRVQRNNGQTGVGEMVFGYPLDTNEIIRLRNNPVAFKGLFATGANWSPADGMFEIGLYVGTGAAAKRGGGFTNETTLFNTTVSLAAGSSAISVATASSIIVPTNATQGELQIRYTPVSTAGANDYIELDDFELENKFTENWLTMSYERLPFEVMLSGCKTHYQNTFPYGVAPAQAAGSSGALAIMANAIAQIGFYWQYPAEMRATAENTTYNPLGASANWQDITTTVSLAVSLDTANSASPKGILVYGVSVSAANHICLIHAAASAGI